MIHVEDFDAAEMMGFGNFGSLNPQTHYHEITEDLNRIPTELERDTEDGDFKKKKNGIESIRSGGSLENYLFFFFRIKIPHPLRKRNRRIHPPPPPPPSLPTSPLH